MADLLDPQKQQARWEAAMDHERWIYGEHAKKLHAAGDCDLAEPYERNAGRWASLIRCGKCS